MCYSDMMRRFYVNYFHDVEMTYLSAPASETVQRVCQQSIYSDRRNDVLPLKKISYNSMKCIVIIIISLWRVRLFIYLFFICNGFATPFVIRIHAQVLFFIRRFCNIEKNNFTVMWMFYIYYSIKICRICRI
jgi:hypothetical protein